MSRSVFTAFVSPSSYFCDLPWLFLQANFVRPQECTLAPRTCENFIGLCEKGYYKNTIFHRVIPGFMVRVRSYPRVLVIFGYAWFSSALIQIVLVFFLLFSFCCSLYCVLRAHGLPRQIQGGDPTGTGHGGQSLWKKPFPDEFHKDV
jgi:hypothetical protein